MDGADFKEPRSLARAVKLVYCPSCRHVSMKARFERDKCERCRGAARIVRVPYPWQYGAGVAVVLAGAMFLILPQASPNVPWAAVVSTFPLRVAWLILFVGTGFFLSNWGVRVMKARALTIGADAPPEAEA